MIYHELFGQHLRLGNFLFKYAWSIKMREQYHANTTYPDYYLWKYLKNPPLISNTIPEDIEIIRPLRWEWNQEDDHVLGLKASYFPEKDISIALNFFFQSEKWFENYTGEVWTALKFKTEVLKELYYKYLYFFQKPTIGIGVRLGDFIGHGDFYQIPYTWYTDTLEKHFPNWRTNYNVVVFSDDIDLAKKIFSGFPELEYAEPNGTHTHIDNFKHYHSEKAIDQFILGTMMDHWIVGNSTFSWWQAYLACHQKKFSKVIHSGKVFSETGNMAHCDTSNYYPKWWIHESISN